jgi:mono/diheme cytochrome c family protein
MKNGFLHSIIGVLVFGWLGFGVVGTLISCQQNPYWQGELLYNGYCVSCHMEDGSGLEGIIPPLAGADYLTLHADQVPCIIRYGIQDTIVVNGVSYHQPMAGIDNLTDIEIANIINYLNNAWGNSGAYFSIGQVRSALENCSTD